ncbi:hypothetical protein BH10BAC2_BH10BAC2_48850 [soil metagenome]
MKYIHYRSVWNFINELDNIQPESEKQHCQRELLKYLNVVEENIDELIDSSVTIALFNDYLYPLGIIYKKIEFLRITPLRISFTLSIIADILMCILFWKYPLPILATLTLINYFIINRKYYKKGKVFGRFY